MKNAIIGCISKYTIEEVKYWCQSIDDFNFDGDKIMIVFDPIPQETLDFLKSKSFQLIKGLDGTNLLDDRFLTMYLFLSRNKYDFVIHCDVKDAVFQSDPFVWLKNKINQGAVVGSECIRCKDMPWATENYSRTFPLEWEPLKDNVSFCCGMIAGKHEFMKDFLLLLWKYNRTGNKFGDHWWCDQAALNILLNLTPIEKSFCKSFHSDGFVCHLGLSLAEPNLRKFITDTIPTYDKEGFVFNENGDKFCIVHQYDRIPDLKNKIHSRYV